MSSPDPASWYVKIGDSEYGPYTGNQLKQYAAEGRITHDALVRQGKSMWALAGSIDGLFHSPPPPASSSRPNPVDWNAILAKPSTKVAASSAAKQSRSSSHNWIVIGLLGTIATCAVLATLFYVVLPIFALKNIAKNIASARAQVDEAFLLVGGVTYDFGPVGIRANGGYRFYAQVTNRTSTPLNSCVLHVRVRRPDRPLPDYVYPCTTTIIGGIKPGETLPIVGEAPYSLQEFASDPNSIVEVSVDQNTWYPARKK